MLAEPYDVVTVKTDGPGVAPPEIEIVALILVFAVEIFLIAISGLSDVMPVVVRRF